MKKWTEQQVIDSLIEASIEYPALDAKTYARWSVGKDIPSITTIINVFGSWREALQAAGLSSIRPYFSDQEILAFIKEASTRLHPFHSNSYREWAKAKHGPSLTLINLRFGSWSRALEEAQIEMTRSISMTEERIITALLEASDVLPRLTTQTYAIWAQENGHPTVATIARKYGSWADALACLDIAPPRRKWVEEDVLEALRQAQEELPSLSIIHYRKWAEGRSVPSTSTINALFGSWTSAVQCLKRARVSLS
ncbi:MULTISPECIES: homing endonuclease associated repeat-containing protein [Exiguobacterium]|uniref:Uncharacterized protein n=1 Tax=Exiguobacterium acetylicum TaxID=41170 RepID=A0ABX8G8C2_EXIAC|nr:MULTISPECIES: hypothetical protein [Exiguobacterium]QWB29691.1 hypothetical protein KKI46_14015 [Exiguobacterium acetylicum]